MFYSVQYKNDCLAASELFQMFAESITNVLSIPLFRIKEYGYLKNVIDQKAIKHEWSVRPFQQVLAKVGLVFALTAESAFCWRFHSETGGACMVSARGGVRGFGGALLGGCSSAELFLVVFSYIRTESFGNS